MSLLARSFPKQPPVSVIEKLVAGFSAFVSIAILWYLKEAYPVLFSNTLLASMGATAVLLFATPHSTLVQPYAILGGHFVSALIGIAAQQFVAAPYAAAVAVGGAITAMHLLHCLHPPGGATALYAVTGGPTIWDLGFSYVLAPVAANAGLMLLMGFVINNLRAPGKLYPAPLPVATAIPESTKDFQRVTPDDIKEAVTESGTYIDVTEEDLLSIYQAAEGNVFKRLLSSHLVESLSFGGTTTLDKNASLINVLQGLAVSETGCVIVLDPDRKVEGIITGVDVSRIMGFQPTPLESHFSKESELVATAIERAEDLMTSPVRTISRSDRMDAAAALLASGDIHHVPVIDENQRFIGVITHTHIWLMLGKFPADSSHRKDSLIS